MTTTTSATTGSGAPLGFGSSSPTSTGSGAPLGFGSSTPSTTAAPTDGFAALGETKGGLPRSVNIPTNIYQAGLLSDTSWADDCFVGQKFSQKLQAYLVGYVGSIYSQYSVYM
jgi:hypothetical protein